MNNKISSLTNAKVLVVGDVMLDRYWQGETSRISPEAPVPVVHVKTTHELPGGAGNVALNISALGAQVTLLSAIGQDEAGQQLQMALEKKHVSTLLSTFAQRPTTTKLRLMSQHQQLIRIDFEDSQQVIEQGDMLNNFHKQLPKIKAVILSDYAKGLLTDPQAFIQAARSQNIPVLVDPKTNDFSCYRGATMVTPNYKEFEAVVGVCADEETMVARGQALIEDCDLQALLITRGAKGMTLLQKQRPPKHYPAVVHEVFDVTGAGDTVIALLASAISVGLSFEQATEIANTAAGIVVTKLGAASVSISELKREYANKMDVKYGVVTESELKLELQTARAKNETIVMTNGCFDLIHAGHVKYLKEAKALGHRLLIAVNDDDSVKRLKGPKRPINTLARRMQVLAALEFVDWVVPFSEDTPKRLITEVMPDILVKGGDYQVADVVGGDIVTENGGRVEIIEYQAGFSTTNIINSIKEVEEIL